MDTRQYKWREDVLAVINENLTDDKKLGSVVSNEDIINIRDILVDFAGYNSSIYNRYTTYAGGFLTTYK